MGWRGMTRIRLQYVHEYLDRHGRARRYFRRPGFKRIPLPGAPGSDEFMTAYQLALAGQPPRIEMGAGRTKPGQYKSCHRAIPRFGVCLGRVPGWGRPNLWAPNAELRRL